jgi:hypothetical protein
LPVEWARVAEQNGSGFFIKFCMNSIDLKTNKSEITVPLVCMTSNKSGTLLREEFELRRNLIKIYFEGFIARSWGNEFVHRVCSQSLLRINGTFLEVE